jgi:hypothetical protein
MTSPVDQNEFIIAIAAQERRVLELREELNRAESELTRLKKQLTASERTKKHNELRNAEPLRPLAHLLDGPAQEEGAPSRRSVEIDRRKALLMGQNAARASPRRVFRGGHTRTLSLLSPVKTTGGGFSVHEDIDASSLKSPDLESASISAFNPSAFNPALSKRSSWQPRSNQSIGVKQIAEDFKVGLWSFVEDIRQATVGEEPITGQSTRSTGIDYGSKRDKSAHASDQDTIRPAAASRPSVATAFDLPSTFDTSGTSKKASGAKSSTSVKAKHYSWTPLTFDSFDDNDWSNWESPSSIKSPRWSGSTVSGGDAISPIPEKSDEIDTPL